jgi:CHASE2 domain-containing sensor protein
MHGILSCLHALASRHRPDNALVLLWEVLQLAEELIAASLARGVRLRAFHPTRARWCTACIAVTVHVGRLIFACWGHAMTPGVVPVAPPSASLYVVTCRWRAGTAGRGGVAG